MIESVRIQGMPTYRGKEHIFGPLGTFNFVFGCNGSGKTTLARIIADPSQYPTCKVEWRTLPLTAYVYDRAFVSVNFRQDLKGVFTLGAKDIGLKERIDAAKSACDVTVEKIRKLREQLDGDGTDIGERAKLKSLGRDFEGKCYKAKQDHYKKLEEAMAGSVGTQAKFTAKVLGEHVSNKAALLPLEDLVAKYAKLYGSSLAPMSSVNVLDVDGLAGLETNAILSKVVVGKSDVAIAALIATLGNSDWVDQGRGFLAKCEAKCPFCQQPAPADLQQHLEEYFDKTFAEDSAALATLESEYRRLALELQQDVNAVLAAASDHLSKDAVAKEKQLIDATIAANLTQIEGKRREPSHVVTLQSLKAVCVPLVGIIDAANTAITAHNAVLANLSAEREQLVAEVWKFVIEQVKDEVSAYVKAKQHAEAKISAIEAKIGIAEGELKQQQIDLHTLEKSATSVKPTIKDINDILESFGFPGYKLAEGTAPDTYQIIRPDGQAASETLSEGEKTFVTFLYFYHLIRGSNSDSGTLENRIVVFDDPVSSLDSNVLFIVSSLVRRLMRAVHDGCEIKQVIILTHNVFFHKEVTLQRRKQTFGHQTFWVIRKSGNDSTIEGHANKNPVKSSYERLWTDLQHRDGSPESLRSLQNTMRRILENYFTILGGVDLGDLEEKFDGKEKLLCRALVAWVHDGSHSIHDDLFMSDSDASAEMFLDIFKRIFEQLQHSAHYDMMMEGRIDALPLPDPE